jgi:hypothetical protein
MVDGDDGNDVIDGGNNHDVLHGNAGNDNIVGGQGEDTLYGDAGNDTLTDSDGVNYLDGGELVGFVFVLRDFAQREVGHNIWWAMLAGCALSYCMASPFVAIASASAFLRH